MLIFLLFWTLSLSTINAAVFSALDIKVLQDNFLANITPEGAIMASPSKVNPNYYYDWVRDSAIAMDIVAVWYEQSKTFYYKKLLLNYVTWSERIQKQASPFPGQDILGEPKFYLEGYPYDGEWGRPQNDGPALRALTLTHFARILLGEGRYEYVRKHLYDNNLESDKMGIIKTDLEYTAHHWQDKNYDLWEEVYGDHFFTRLVQRHALLEGAFLARQLNDVPAALYYEKQAKLIAKALMQHVNKNDDIILASLPPHPGPQKTDELDSSVLLGVLITYPGDHLFTPNNQLVKNTILALKEQFRESFPINNHHHDALLFGRYPGDKYDGYGLSVGNPWFILTAAMAEYYYSLADHTLKTVKNINTADRYLRQGDNYLSLIKIYAPDLKLSEQINLNTGLQQGAHSLTWSYIAVLRAILLREKIEHSRLTAKRTPAQIITSHI